MAGPRRLGEKLEASLAVGPELDADGLSDLREHLSAFPNAQVYALWLRGRANGVMIAFGRPAEPLSELARQAAAAITLADRYTDVFARRSAASSRRRPPRSSKACSRPASVGSPAGKSPGTYSRATQVAGDWFDVIENADGVWVTLADGLGARPGRPRAAPSQWAPSEPVAVAVATSAKRWS